MPHAIRGPEEVDLRDLTSLGRAFPCLDGRPRSVDALAEGGRLGHYPLSLGVIPVWMSTSRTHPDLFVHGGEAAQEPLGENGRSHVSRPPASRSPRLKWR